MKVKPRIITPKFKDYFAFEFKYSNIKDNIYFNTQIFNKFVAFIFFTSFCLLAGFLKKEFWAVGIANTILLLFLYFKTKKIAQGIIVKRFAPKFSRERQTIVIEYECSNATGFNVRSLQFIEKFDGVQTGSYQVDLDQGMLPQTQFSFSKSVKLDAGMGIKKFEPIELELTDELGIFKFRIEFNQINEIDVYPYIEEIPQLKNAISTDAIGFGLYEIYKRGDSNLFIGTREYRHGDPIKHINWRLSKKTNKIIINEYEKNTHSYITLLLELDLDLQLGQGELSTWEVIKDFALSLSSNELIKNNYIQIVSRNLFIPFGTGKNQLNLFEKHLTLHELDKKENYNYLARLNSLPSKGQVYYLCPFINSPKVKETFEILMNLRKMGHEITIITFDPFEEISHAIKGDIKIGLYELHKIVKNEFTDLENKFMKNDIKFFNFKVKRPMSFVPQMMKRNIFLNIETQK